ncbi:MULTISPECIES: bifunctional adenosylcobinamide kinase/adenosylcobinamide-phosphate guanylyltransferase [unclassified Mycobacterium]|uniref:bifunctional adenosylcobinamide kinase/adenosylcobinamide-phosphate guanylyltransferase n=1 Tax=unclassified Mycobacterium TaxID=2642494 RepID=UPI0006DD35C5|nr:MULTISPECIES: bifunctional adenosylcobinamide kinase/adenosylcobinamide-phosphate guanylyltransferase [unclassified Mycobacterium]OBG66265.1 adenosylcobinamide kinase/adenosylcobinamide phosphate guanyltransferase [Mycobacterium sp. E3339]OBH86453.1 adenosylcobinamide kinase/adenosylcobinamide phosphate guanyltransferase [Mycobacterium sp. E2989]
MRTLVLGGIRSGKSRWAEDAIAGALPAGQPVCYLAPGPAGAGDAAWADRVAEHRGRRPGHWSTVETDDIASQLRASPDTPTLVDDLGAWLTGALDRHGWDGGSVAAPVGEVLAAVSDFNSTLVLVSPEVGLAVVPATASGRRFADELGSLNQRVADLCDRVVLVVAGQAVPIKPSGA